MEDSTPRIIKALKKKRKVINTIKSLHTDTQVYFGAWSQIRIHDLEKSCHMTYTGLKNGSNNLNSAGEE